MAYLTAIKRLKEKQETGQKCGEIGHEINTDRTKTLQNNSKTADPVRQYIEDVTEFTRPVHKVANNGNTYYDDIKTRIRKVN